MSTTILHWHDIRSARQMSLISGSSRQLLGVMSSQSGDAPGCRSWVPTGRLNWTWGLRIVGGLLVWRVVSWQAGGNGELFDMEALTAAHRTPALGSVVRVVI